jgi:hypothetical protein
MRFPRFETLKTVKNRYASFYWSEEVFVKEMLVNTKYDLNLAQPLKFITYPVRYA